MATLGVPPPGDAHDRVQSGRFLRALLIRSLVLALVLWALVAVTDLSNWWLLLGA